jgi:hypothetical protein
VTLAIAFAALTAYFAFTTGFGVVASAYLAYASVGAAVTPYLAAIPGVGWVILAVIAIIAIAGVDVGSELANFEDSVKEFGSDVDDAIFGEDGLIGGLFSDIRTKEKVKFINQVIPGLNLYSFEYKPEFKNHPLAGSGRYIGFMAHEVEKLYPNAVKVQPNGYKSVNYSLIGI